MFRDKNPKEKDPGAVLICCNSRTYLDQIGALQNKLRDSQVSSHDHHEILKSELLRRDETIQKLRKDVLHFQEKRDAYQAEVM